MCQTLPPPLLDTPDSVGLGFSVQSLHMDNPFATSALTSLSVVTSSIGLDSHSFGDQVTQGEVLLHLFFVLMSGEVR